MIVRKAIRALVAVSLFVALPLGCRNIIGVQERVLVDGGALSCDTYCAEIASACTGSDLQYASPEVCTKLCEKVDLGTLDDVNGDTIGCRLATLRSSIAVGELDCQAAGPASDTCGGKCDVYCKLMPNVCPTQAAKIGDCAVACKSLLDCGSYVAVDQRNDASIQCRMFHLNSALIAAPHHCPHTIGEDLRCDQPAPDAGLCDDGGT